MKLYLVPDQPPVPVAKKIGEMNDETERQLEASVRDIMECRATQVARFCDLVKGKLGPDFENLELVEDRSPERVRWYFQRKKP